MRLLTVAVLVTVLLAACNNAAGQNDATRAEGAAGSVPVTSPVQPREDLFVSPPAGKGSLRQLTGTVSGGVESGCLVLNARDGRYLLVGGDRATLRPGARVIVTGEVMADLASTCQQGTPFLVRSVRTA